MEDKLETLYKYKCLQTSKYEENITQTKRKGNKKIWIWKNTEKYTRVTTCTKIIPIISGIQIGMR